MNGHAGPVETFDSIVRAARVGDNAIIGVDGRLRPSLRVGRLIQRYRVDCDFHAGLSISSRKLTLPRRAGLLPPKGAWARVFLTSASLSDRDQPPHEPRPGEFVVAIEEENLFKLRGERANAEGINRSSCSAIANFSQQDLGQGNLRGIFTRRLPVEIFDKEPAALSQQRKEFA